MLCKIRRAHHVGSLLRHSQVLESWNASNADLRRNVEDKAIEEDLQRFPLTLDITDGEQRRRFFHTYFFEKVDGFKVTYDVMPIATVKRAGGGVRSAAASEDFKGPVLSLTGVVRHEAPVLVDDFESLASMVDQGRISDIKITMPSPVFAVFAVAGWREAYKGDVEQFEADILEVYRREFRALFDAGCRRVQLDECMLPAMCDPQWREMVKALDDVDGGEPSAVIARWASLLNRVLRSRPAGMIAGVHLCRGNFRSEGFAKGSYDYLAEKVFTSIVSNDLWLLEYDCEEITGGFEGLRFMPADKIVSLGLISSKFGDLENVEEIREKIDDAAEYLPRGKEQIAIGLQCGFSSSHHGNVITRDEQFAKLQHVADLAEALLPSGGN